MNKDFHILNLDNFTDERGTLVSLLNDGNLPFEIKRIYYICAKQNAERANLSHRTQKQILVSVSGQCKVLLDNGSEQTIIELNEPNKALYINKLVWRKLFDFSPNSTILSLNSESYNEKEIIRNYDEFLTLVQGEN